jgi:tetratricopeptide (TPR) repeat protein
MEIHILQAGEQLGPFSETQVRQYLGAGVVSPSDLASCEAMPDWQSLDHLLAHLPTSAPAPEAVLPDVPPPDSPVLTPPAPEPESSLIMHKEASETLELPTAPPADSALPLTASQKTKRKLSKIVIQPILPLEAAAPAPAKKKSQTGKTTLTLAPLRPTTSLPPVTGFAPKQKKNGKTLVRTGPVALRDFSEKPSASPTATPSLAPVTPPEPANWSPPPPPPAPLLPEKTAKLSSEKAWFQRIPPEVLYAGAGLALLLVCLIFSGLYLISSHKTSPAANPETAPPPPSQVVIPSPTSTADPKTAADYSARGFARQAKGDLDGALSDYNQALSLDPKDVEAFYRRGLAHQAQGDLDGALDDYTAVLGLDPNQADAFSNRGFVKQAKGDLDGALADYSQALLINPKIAAAYYNEGLIEVQKGYLDGAIADYNHALDLDPKMAIAYYNRGVAKNSEGNLEGAIADYTQALVLNPQIALAYCNRGFARQSKGDTDGALADYSQALALNPKMAVVFYNRGLIKVQKGDLEGTIADSSQAIDLEPKSGPAYCNRGLARLGTGDLDGAMTDLRKFCELAPKDSGVDSARLYMWVMATEQNPKGTADQELSTSLLNDWNSPPEDLTSKIAAFLLGHIHESDLIANAASPDPSRAPGQYCKVWYFAGMKRLLAGDMATAIKYFQKSVATEQKDSCEYIFAQSELRALGQNRSVAARPEPGL